MLVNVCSKAVRLKLKKKPLTSRISEIRGNDIVITQDIVLALLFLVHHFGRFRGLCPWASDDDVNAFNKVMLLSDVGILLENMFLGFVEDLFQLLFSKELEHLHWFHKFERTGIFLNTNHTIAGTILFTFFIDCTIFFLKKSYSFSSIWPYFTRFSIAAEYYHYSTAFQWHSERPVSTAPSW